MEEELTGEDLGLSTETSGRKAMLVQGLLQSHPRAPEAMSDLVLSGISITIEIQSPRPQKQPSETGSVYEPDPQDIHTLN